jgi:hypothetical protein
MLDRSVAQSEGKHPIDGLKALGPYGGRKTYQIRHKSEQLSLVSTQKVHSVEPDLLNPARVTRVAKCVVEIAQSVWSA